MMNRQDFHIDNASVFHGSVIVTGWCKEDVPITVSYKGEVLKIVMSRFRRGDLVNIFGKAASSWAFNLCAVAAEPYLVHEDVLIIIERVGFKLHEIATAEASNGNSIFRLFQDYFSRKPGSILEIGSRARSGNSYKDTFPQCEDYIGIDITDGEGVDIVCDAHHMASALRRTFDFIFSVSVFEHLLMPWKAALEMNVVMKTGALGYIQSHQGWPLHEEPWDFWRFSTNAWKGLFNKHTGFEIVETGYDLAGSIVPTFAIGGPLQNIERGQTYLMSACIVRKVSEPIVSWSAEVGDVYDLSYDHA